MKAILTDRAPKPIGPYSQAVAAGGLLFCSGQVALDAVSGEVVAEGDVEGQTRLVMENLGAVLKAAGSGFDKVIKTTIYLKSMADFPKVNDIYGSFFGKVPPARATIEVSGLPKNLLVEIDAVALME